jgi:single-stranded-DNA-specific exonuclease
LTALLEAARVNSNYVSASDIAFRVAPLLNAAGRMGKPDAAVQLLTTWDGARAGELAAELSRQNRRRRRVQSAACKEAVRVVRETDGLSESNCIVLSGPDWHQGIAGLVASRVAETFWRPTFVLTTDGETAQGSARSIGGFPLYRAVERCADLLDRFGGHEGAAGVAMPVGNLEEFRERINEVAAELTPVEAPTPELALDGEFQLSQLSLDLLRELDLLAPFGEGNPPPLFAASGLRVVGNPRTVGSGNTHLAFMVRQGNTTLRAFAAGKAEWLDHFRARRGEEFSLAFEPNINRYGGTPKVEMRVEDLQWDEERLVERRPSPE